MKKINLETFKKLFSVKNGGAELFRLFIKFLVWVFILGAFFYGLVWIPNQQLNIEVAKINIDSVKIKRNCEAMAQQQTMQAKAIAEKAGKKITKQDEQSYAINTYNQCVYLQARDDLSLRTKKTNQQVKAQPQVKAEIKNTEEKKEEIKK